MNLNGLRERALATRIAPSARKNLRFFEPVTAQRSLQQAVELPAEFFIKGLANLFDHALFDILLSEH